MTDRPTIEHTALKEGELAHELRRLVVSGSESAALFGSHLWKTGYGLFREKIGAAEISPQESAFLERGHDVEPIARRKFAEQNPKWKVWAANEFLHDREHHLGAHPDAYGEDEEGKFVCIEIKCASGFELKRGRYTDASPPEHVLLQNLTQMYLADAHYGLVILFDLDAWRIKTVYRVDRYPEVENEIANRAKKFMEAVRDGHEPGPDFERDGALLAARYLKGEPGKEIDLRADNRMPELCREYLDVSAEIKNGQARREAVVAEIATKIEDAEIALIHGYNLSNKLIHRRAHMVAETSFRKLSIRSEGDDE